MCVGESLDWGVADDRPVTIRAEGLGLSRTVRGGWRRTDVTGEALIQERRSGAVATLAASRGTSCSVEVAEYVVSQCACRNVFQGMRRLRSGAGSIPWSCRIRFTVVRAISWPRFESAPRIRVYPPWGFSTAIRTTSAATSRRVIGRPRPRRALPSYVWAINLRYQRRIVSGVTMPATCIKTRRPSFWPRTASRRRWASVRRSGRGPRCSRRTRFSSRRYAIRSSWWRFTQPANVRTRNCSAGGMA